MLTRELRLPAVPVPHEGLGVGDLGAQLCVLALVPVPHEGLGDCRDQERPRPPCCSRSP